MTGSRSIAVAQTCPIGGDVQANIEQHLRLSAIAAGEGAQVVVFPELSLTGYELELAESLAFAENDPRLLPLVDAAAAQSITLIVGAPVRLGARLHIGAYILGPDRTIGLYTKQYLGAFGASARVDGIVPAAEATVFRAGDRDPLIQVGGASTALAICADVGQSSHPQLAAQRGARAYLASMFVIPSEFAGEAAKLGRYAVQHEMVVAMANFGSPSGGLASAGRSSIWSETGDVLVQLDASGDGVAVVTESRQGWFARRVAQRARTVT